ncbi:MAG: sigma-70 family RNA polymerase sigma factor [Xanthomonadales bacterium]|nr:sigma-70 family RNA polymerase sigma factor [Xanthomonadales bacterium]
MARRFADHGDIEALLHRLNTAEAGAAWAEFIDRFSPLIIRAVRQFEFQQDRANDCYLYVCEHLCDNGFRRLLRFNTRGKAQFATWLGSVIYHLCVDWHRQEYGRAQMLPAIAALPALERAVYRLHFEQALNREACLQTLRDEYPDLSREMFSAAISQVFKVLTPRQRWQMNLRQQRKPMLRGGNPDVVTLGTDLQNPRSETESVQRREQLAAAMTRLDPELRLVLNLRYVEGMTLQKIADLLKLRDAFRARRMVERALDQMFRLLPARSADEM